MAKTPAEPTKSRGFILGVSIGIVYLVFIILTFSMKSNFLVMESGIIEQRFQVVVGLPLAALLSFMIVILLPQAYGKIEFKILGMNFKGAAGPVVLWIFCFLAITFAIKLLW
jgi:hypothetical protein